MTRRWIFRALALVGVPLILFLLVEGGFRLAGYGHPHGFWTSGKVAGANVAVDNPYFSWPIFGARRARLATPFALKRPKTQGVTRVFVLGGSAIQGDPDPSYSAARFLEVLLPAAWPDLHFEVVNAGMTAIDSTVVEMIASDVMALQPDLLVLYMGNNEVVGPFGPNAGGHGRRMIAGIRRWLLQFRLGQFVARRADEARLRRGDMKDWQGLEAFLDLEIAPTDGVLDQVRSRFDTNVRAILEIAQDAGVPVVLCTVGVNLADSPPFSSGSLQDLGTEQREQRQRLVDQATQFAIDGDFDQSMNYLEEAQSIDGESADIEFIRGTVLLAAGRQAEALRAFEISRDLDRLRFRADSSINQIVRDAAEHASGSTVLLADVENAMVMAAKDGVPGRQFFHEHVHLTFEGTSVLAREVIRVMDQGLEFTESPAQELPSDGEVAFRLALTGWSQVRLGSEILERIQRPPFTGQLGHEAAVRAIEQDLGELGPFIRSGGLENAKAVLSEAVARNPDDWFHAYNLGLLLRQLGDDHRAIQQFRTVLRMRPSFSMARKELGRALVTIGQPAAAVTAFRRVAEVHPYSVEAMADLGVALVMADRGSEAVSPLERALRLEPDTVSVLYHLALAQASEGSDGRRLAIKHLRRLLTLDPTHRDAVIVLKSLEGSEWNP